MDAEDDDIPAWNESGGEATQGGKLTTERSQQLTKLLEEFQSLFTALPGHTTVTEHRITTGDAPPIRLPPYHLPHALQRELKQMLAQPVPFSEVKVSIVQLQLGQ